MSDAPTPFRRIRSFVIRGGRMTAGQERALEKLLPRYGIEFSQLPVDFETCFGRRARRMMEIGFGAGESLLEYARAHPDIDCLGVEVHRPGVGHLLLDAHSAQLNNLRVICHDAVEVLAALTPGSLDAVHIFFPDPWHKKRHHKRRLIQPSFAELLSAVLKPKGVVRMATDWHPYAVQMLEVLTANPSFRNTSVSGDFVARPGDRPLTRFERRGHRLGHDVWDLEFERIEV